MQIKALCEFKHDRFVAEAGKTYEMGDALATYFINAGWAEGPNGERVISCSSEHIIEVDSANIATGGSGATLS